MPLAKHNNQLHKNLLALDYHSYQYHQKEKLLMLQS
jgi:hypothetical protein